MGRHSLELKKSRHYFLATSKSSSKMVKIINILGLALVGTAAANEPFARKDVKKLFKSADSNADRQLDLAELGAYFSTLSEEEVDQILAIGDNNGDDKLNFNEFFQVIDDDENRKGGSIQKMLIREVTRGLIGLIPGMFGNGQEQ